MLDVVLFRLGYGLFSMDRLVCFFMFLCVCIAFPIDFMLTFYLNFLVSIIELEVLYVVCRKAAAAPCLEDRLPASLSSASSCRRTSSCRTSCRPSSCRTSFPFCPERRGGMAVENRAWESFSEWPNGKFWLNEIPWPVVMKMSITTETVEVRRAVHHIPSCPSSCLFCPEKREGTAVENRAWESFSDQTENFDWKKSHDLLLWKCHYDGDGRNKTSSASHTFLSFFL